MCCLLVKHQIVHTHILTNVSAAVIGLCRYYMQMLDMGKADGTLLLQDNLYSSGMLRPFIIEFFILLIHPVPFVHFEIHLHEVFGYTIYTSDDFFTVLMLPRVYLLARVLRDELKLTHETVNYHGSLVKVNLENPLVIIKQIVLDFPLVFVPVLYASTVLIAGYAMMCLERPTNEDFFYFQNALWAVLQTVTMVGFGDMYPTTNFGRLSAMFACGVALTNYTIMVIGVKNIMTYSAKELKCFHWLKRKQWVVVRDLQAAILIQAFWRSSQQLSAKLSVMPVYLRDTKLCAEVRKFRKIRAMEPLEVVNASSEAYSLYCLTHEMKARVDKLEQAVAEYTDSGHNSEARI